MCCDTDSDVSDTYISDSSTHSLNDDSSFCADESVQETQEETTTASTGSLSTRPGRREAKKQYYLKGKSRKPYRAYRGNYNDHWKIAIQLMILLCLVVFQWHLT